ncbi:hypothetical protein PP427_gp102 [Salmonella phage KM16]|uniref:hypothetical protein n=1 Tax=Salmonella phage KM16 TaxID=2797303 RepID=UPI00249375BE|nr:hypothetical protein PP427_gp102 [Salmonella phage KM16]
MKEGVDYIHDYRGTAIGVGDVVALYYGYGGLETGEIIQIKNNRVKVEVTYSNGSKVISKWKYGECMVKL